MVKDVDCQIVKEILYICHILALETTGMRPNK